MKILIYGLNFFPELTGIGKYSGEMAVWLSSRGHDIRVITAPPYYPQWSIKAGYKSWAWRYENLDNIKVMRCPLWVPSHQSGIKRLIHLASFALSSVPIVLGQIFWRPHVIVIIEPPLFIAPAGLILAKICSSLSVLHIQDYEINAAFNLNFLRGKVLRRWALGAEHFLMRKFNIISTISNKMLSIALEKKISAEKLYLLPNWANLNLFKNIDIDKARREYCKSLGIPLTSIIALYSGSMGAKQGLEILVDVAKRCEWNDQPSSPIYFVFCGAGAGKTLLINQCIDLKNVRFLDLQPNNMMPHFLSMVDIHLLPQRSNIADLVMPSKLIGMLASGKSILASARSGTELANTLEGRGVVVEPDNADAFFEGLKLLVDDYQLRDRLGAAGKIYAEMNLSIDVILGAFERNLLKLTKK